MDSYNKSLIKYIKQSIDNYLSDLVAFYHMENSGKMLDLFNQFGYLLICNCVVNLESNNLYFPMSEFAYTKIPPFQHSDIESLSDDKLKEHISFLCHHVKTIIEQKYNFYFIFLKEINLTIIQITVLRRMMSSIQKIIIYQKDYPEVNLLEHTINEMSKLCICGKSRDLNNISPIEMSDVIAQLLKEFVKEKNGDSINLLNLNCGSGKLLFSAKKYIENIKAVAYESHKDFCLAVQIQCLFLDFKANIINENFTYMRANQKYDIVMAAIYLENNELLYGERHMMLSSLRQEDKQYISSVKEALLATGEEGYCALILSDNLLLSERDDVKSLRELIVNEYRLEAVIRLIAPVFNGHIVYDANLLIISNPEKNKMQKHITKYVFFYDMNMEVEDTDNPDMIKQAIENLIFLKKNSEQYYSNWNNALHNTITNFYQIQTPRYWEHRQLWFASYDAISSCQYNLLPRQYKPIQYVDAGSSLPEELLSDWIRMQEEILIEMKELQGMVQQL